MIYITGDTHGDFSRFEYEPYTSLTKADAVIILGDFGGIWAMPISPNLIKEENEKLDFLATLPFNIFFIDGNHENFARLADFPIEKKHNGLVHVIRPNVFHLIRGEIFTIENHNFFAFGGAASHDIDDGILDPADYDSLADCRLDDYIQCQFNHKMVRIKNISWWEAEMPSRAEMDAAIANLKAFDGKIDFVLTHSLPTEALLMAGFDTPNRLNNFFQNEVLPLLNYRVSWYTGHYHEDYLHFFIDNINYIFKYEETERIV